MFAKWEEMFGKREEEAVDEVKVKKPRFFLGYNNLINSVHFLLFRCG